MKLKIELILKCQFVLFLLIMQSCTGQNTATKEDKHKFDFAIYKDTIEKFEINIPKKWINQTDKDSRMSLIIISDEKIKNETQTNFNLQILNLELTDLNESYFYYLQNLEKAKEFKILESGEKIIHKRKYKWLVEYHKNHFTDEDMINYNLFTNKDGKVLVLTMVSTKNQFEKIRPVFEDIMKSLKF